jgi:hypothetical protein
MLLIIQWDARWPISAIHGAVHEHVLMP